MGTIFTIFCMTQPWIERTTYQSQGGHFPFRPLSWYLPLNVCTQNCWMLKDVTTFVVMDLKLKSHWLSHPKGHNFFFPAIDPLSPKDKELQGNHLVIWLPNSKQGKGIGTIFTVFGSECEEEEKCNERVIVSLRDSRSRFFSFGYTSLHACDVVLFEAAYVCPIFTSLQSNKGEQHQAVLYILHAHNLVHSEITVLSAWLCCFVKRKKYYFFC